MSDQMFTGRVVYVAPESGAGGVGAYADVFGDELRAQVEDVVEIRHGRPGTESVRELLDRRRLLRGLIADRGAAPIVVHCELSGGSLESFWPTANLHDPRHGVIASATVHDPPGLVWWPARTKLLARLRLINHGVHFPTRPAIRVLERRIAGRRPLFALSAAGAGALRARYPQADVHSVPFFVHEAAEIIPAEERPLAVGMFGLIYRGKGFEHIARIRAQLDTSIAMRIAGRGTEDLPQIEGVEVLGGLDGAELDEFFASIRALLIPYGRRSPYGEAFPASSVVAHAVAYLTPMVATAQGSLAEMADEGGAVIVAGGNAVADVGAAVAAAAGDLVNDFAKVRELATELRRLRLQRTAEQVVASYVDVWGRA